jgi:hypothetical protein
MPRSRSDYEDCLVSYAGISKQLYRRFVETGGTVQIQEDGITVSFERRSHNPILRDAALDREPIPIPWLEQRSLAFTFR